MLLLIHNDFDDPITNLVMTQSQRLETRLRQPVQVLSLTKIIEDATIYDVIDDGKAHIQWTFPDIGPISNSEDVRLISRIPGITEELFQDFHEDDKEYALTEFSAYLHFALEAFPSKLSSPGYFGLSGQRFPMPLQWQLVKERYSPSSDCSVPSYYLGPLEFCPFAIGRLASLDQGSDIIFNHPYGYRHWKPGAVPESGMVFAVKKPKGSPYFALVVDTECLVMNGPESGDLSREVMARLKKMSFEISRTLECPICELLFFIDDKSITFAVADIIPVATPCHPEFSKTVMDGIATFFARTSHGKKS